ncbi:single-stranded DNA-binding protein [Candidatus Sumerlaeota bacterium]|nr:single-stranded DNA-binding protein [Candidatus Sumerlaeota bacterium]
MNRVILIGNLTRDPELKYLQNNNAVCRLGVAVNRRVKNQDGTYRDEADFFDIEVWGNQAANCQQYLAKGKKVGIDGHLRQDTWQDNNTGQQRSRVKVVAERVEFLSPANQNGQPGQQQQQQYPPQQQGGYPQQQHQPPQQQYPPQQYQQGGGRQPQFQAPAGNYGQPSGNAQDEIPF